MFLSALGLCGEVENLPSRPDRRDCTMPFSIALSPSECPQKLRSSAVLEIVSEAVAYASDASPGPVWTLISFLFMHSRIERYKCG